MGWSREAVKNYKSLNKIDKEAWEIIGTGFKNIVPDDESDDVPESGTGVPKSYFSENLLRNILDLDPGQQVELCGYLAIADTLCVAAPAPRPWRGALPQFGSVFSASLRSAPATAPAAAFAAPPQARRGASGLPGSSLPTLRRAGRPALGGGYSLALSASFFGHGAPIKKPAFSDRQAVMMVALRTLLECPACRVWRQRETVAPRAPAWCQSATCCRSLMTAP